MFGRPNGIGFADCELKDISDDELFGEPAIEGMRTSSNEISGARRYHSGNARRCFP
jgi:hypothetical protein